MLYHYVNIRTHQEMR